MLSQLFATLPSAQEPVLTTVELGRHTKVHGLVPALKHLSYHYIKLQILKGLYYADLFIHQHRFAGGTLPLY